MTHNLTTGDRVKLVDRHGIDYPTWRDLAYHVLRVESVDRGTAVVVPDRDYLYSVPHQRTVAVADLAPVTHVFTVRRLTSLNVRAIDDALRLAALTGVVETTATTATFYGNTPADVLARLDAARECLADTFGRRGHPVASLAAVQRKLLTAGRGEGDGAVSAVEISREGDR